jgi:hypothetical protein
VSLFHETVCDNDLDGILFDDTNPTLNQYVKCYNSIFRYNLEDVDISFPSSPSGLWHCNWYLGLPVVGQGNNSFDPNFDDGDYHLDSNSDLIDIGNYNYSNGLRFDMEGDDRKIEVTVDETDIGADEFDPEGQG